ncbi:uncharacterized protein BT62DRAFT_1011874 [Guyanagaster necrorhizus]|uniref:Uncharacterized protein n=1 Tax=Guyanagaster necrorhizus TaxID=856835 RepID=A0A9P7VJR9_9AGAR|nr:uncharacterized protein BT62DRAFT_1011874 [Guyanagaster necrorhizus MCA 3950]KAG7441281.1 hypothetical protein BT62DRAFT_1011874 [Guyanagaster necrorhizus MCA 3950]
MSVYNVVADTNSNQSDSGSSAYASRINCTTLSLSFTLATTLPCTHAYHLPSRDAALYSASTIVYMVFVARNILTRSYPNVINAYITGIAPTLTVGWVASGHTRPCETYLRFVSVLFGPRPEKERRQRPGEFQ